MTSIFYEGKIKERECIKGIGMRIKHVFKKYKVLMYMVFISFSCVFSFAGCVLSDISRESDNATDNTQVVSGLSDESTDEVIKLGEEGKYCFQISIVYPDETKEIYEIKTNEDNVGAALYGVGLIDDPEYFTVVNNVEADWNKDGAYWSVFEAGDFATKGISEYKTSDKINNLELRYTK